MYSKSMYIVYLQIILPYSSLEQRKDLKIWTARPGPISGNSVNQLLINCMPF